MGYAFRSRIETSRDGSFTVIQMKDLQDNNTVNCKELVKVDLQSVKEHHLARKGDLIFRSRGLVSTAAILLDDLEKAIVSAPLLKIQITEPGLILPEYLNWYINQKDAQIFFNSRAKGTLQKMISKQALEELDVSVPTIEKQKRIVALAALSDQEQALLHKLANMRQYYISTKLMQTAKGE